MQQFERQFEERLQTLQQDSRACARAVYAGLTFHHVTGHIPGLYDRVQLHAGFWTGILASLQAAGFVALGRLYDDDSNNHCLRSLLDYAGDNYGIFSRAELEARKIKGGLSPADAKLYASDAFELQKGGLNDLKKTFIEKQALYRSAVRSVRHEVFAHSGSLNRNAREELFTRVFVREIEELAVFPLQIERALFGLYQNGREPTLDHAPTKIGDAINAVPTVGTNTWDHLHVVKDTETFLEWMASAEMPDGE